MYRALLRFVALGTTLRALRGPGGVQGGGLRLAELSEWLGAAAGGKGEAGEEGEADGLAWEVSNVDLLARLPRIVQRVGEPGEGEVPGGGGEIAAMDPAQLACIPPFASLAVNVGASNEAESGSLLRSVPSGRPTNVPSPAPSLPPTLSTFAHDPEHSPERSPVCRSVEFTGPGCVRVLEEPIAALQPGQVRVRAECSLVSPGTELKVFRGDVDLAEAADTAIAALGGAGGSLAFPLRYGYSLVGTVVEEGPCAAGDESSDPGPSWVGRRVFAFSPHGSHAVCDRAALLPVPEGISAEDAAFLPAVETALALAMEAQPRLGERVCVVGQGLVGLLCGALLHRAMPGAHLTLADVNVERLAEGGRWSPGASLWDPSKGAAGAGVADPAGADGFDVVVEVSGHGSGLQAALDSASRGGRVVLGSMYGEAALGLRLGLAFHRSGLVLRASQVSHIPPELSGRWTKARRFAEAWRLVRVLEPSRLLGPGARVPLETRAVQAAYDRLARGEAVTALFVPDAP